MRDNLVPFLPILTLCLLFAQCRPLAGEDGRDNHSSDTFDLTDYIPQNGPGVAALVAHNGRILYQGAAGYADVRARTAMKPEMLFNLASVSKQMTAMAVLLLEAEGKLKDSDSIRRHLPELPQYTERVTIGHLIHHQSGLPAYEEICEGTTPMRNQAVIDFVKASTGPDFAPGTKYEYSNTGYVLLAEIVGRASRTRFDEFMQKRIFERAGMKHTFVLTPDSLSRYRTLPVKGYHESGEPGPYAFAGCDTLSGDGSVISSVQDLDRWFTALHTNKLAGRDHMKKYFTPRRVGSGSNYAYGFEKSTEDGEVTLSHDGSWGGFNSNVTYYPDSHAWIILLSNYDDFESEKLNDALYEEFLND